MIISNSQIEYDYLKTLHIIRSSNCDNTMCGIKLSRLPDIRTFSAAELPSFMIKKVASCEECKNKLA